MHDVVVVGAGPVGAFLTALLLDAGLDAVAVDARADGGSSTRAIGIHPPSIGLLAQIGVDVDVLASGVHIHRGVARTRGRDLGGGLQFTQAGSPPIVALGQTSTQSFLDRAVADRRADGIRRGIRVTGLRREKRSLVLDGMAGPTDWRAGARFVVGADGANSAIRGLTHATATRRGYRDRYVMGDFRDDTGDAALAVLHLEREGIVESFPLPGGVRRWVAHEGTSTGVIDAAGLAELIGRRTGQGPDPSSASMFSRFVPRRAIVPVLAGAGVALIGDAAHEVSPIGGQGMNLGWADAAELARILPGVIADGGDNSELRDFSVRRLAVARRAARQAELNMVLGRPAPGVLHHARAGLAQAVSRPPFDSRAARVFTMASLQTPDVSGAGHRGRLPR